MSYDIGLLLKIIWRGGGHPDSYNTQRGGAQILQILGGWHPAFASENRKAYTPQ